MREVTYKQNCFLHIVEKGRTLADAALFPPYRGHILGDVRIYLEEYKNGNQIREFISVEDVDRLVEVENAISSFLPLLEIEIKIRSIKNPSATFRLAMDSMSRISRSKYSILRSKMT
jgi:hypothetical protein